MSDTVVLSSSPAESSRAGDIIAGKYRLERELGRGAMGTVWAAVHTTLGQRVAIKLIARDQASSPDARRRFSVEAKAAARLRSRHVVQVYDDGETPQGTPYIVMEFLEGETLEERLERQRDVSLGEAVRITSHVGRALARAHAQGIVHRDLKPGNIFIARSDDDALGWVAKVLDFGVAKLTDAHGPSTTKTGTIVGTPLFMSPEQVRGASQVDHRADLYSLGMVFHHMITGEHAFDGPSYSDVLVAICTEPLPDIRATAPWLPSALKSWFERACARERGERFQSADELVEGLLEAAGPGARIARVPDEIGGPSGTLVGHLPPHAAATLHADSVAQPLPGPATEREEPSPMSAQASQGIDAGTLRSRSSPGVSEPPSTGLASLQNSLVVWAAAGVFLAIVTLLIATLVGRLRAPHTATPHSTAAVSTARQASPPRDDDVNPLGAGTAVNAAPPVTTFEIPAAAPPATTVETPRVAPAEPAAPLVSPPSGLHGRPEHQTRSSARSPATQKPASVAEPTALPPSPKPAGAGTPDMGF